MEVIADDVGATVDLPLVEADMLLALEDIEDVRMGDPVVVTHELAVEARVGTDDDTDDVQAVDNEVHCSQIGVKGAGLGLDLSWSQSGITKVNTLVITTSISKTVGPRQDRVTMAFQDCPGTVVTRGRRPL